MCPLHFPYKGTQRTALAVISVFSYYLILILYNEDEEEFEPAEDDDVVATLTKYSARYGEPFSSILEALKKEVAE